MEDDKRENDKDELVRRSRKAFTRLARFVAQLMREQLACGPVTVQQCYTLEALAERPLSMNVLAAEVALHQSTLSRIVEKLEKQGLVERARLAENQRMVEVRLTENGREVHRFLDSECNRMISGLLDLVPLERRAALLESLEEMTRILDPKIREFRKLLAQCCSPGKEIPCDP
ncbi:MAG: MarR family transcriptional regulator [Proteobacteria bacterium]|nr:MarR family transcriptional regulator [Pseudomonadota bacterium]